MKKLIVLMLFLVLCFTGCGSRLSKDVSRTMSNLESKYGILFEHYTWNGTDFYSANGVPFYASMVDGVLNDDVIPQTMGEFVSFGYEQALLQKDVQSEVAVSFLNASDDSVVDKDETNVNLSLAEYIEKYKVDKVALRIVLLSDSYDSYDDCLKNIVDISEGFSAEYDVNMNISVYTTDNKDDTIVFFKKVPFSYMTDDLFGQTFEYKDSFSVKNGKKV